MTKTYNNYEDLLTFTRASKGHALRPVSYGTEEVTNGTYDTDSDWTLQRVSIAGGVADFSDNSLGPARVIQDDVYTVGKIYLVTFDVNESGTLRVYDGASYDGDISVSSGTVSKIIYAEGTQFIIRANVTNDYTGTIDNVSVKEVLFDQPDGTLTLFEHPENVPRVEYDADGNRLGLLVEEARTNLVTYSEDFSNSYWGKNALSVTKKTGIVAPDGSENVYHLQEDTNNLQHQLSVTLTAGTHAFSVFAKGDGSGRYLKLYGYGLGSSSEAPVFDVDNGIVYEPPTQTHFLSASIQDVGNGWYRCSLRADTDGGSGSPTFALVDATDSHGTAGYTGDGTSGVYLYGAQVEAGSFPTSYIKSNSGSTTTRSADVASIPVADFGYNQKAFTVSIEASHLYDTFPSFNRFWELSGGGDTVGLYGNSGSSSYVSMTVGGVSQVSFSDGAEAAADANTFMKYAVGLKTNDFDIARDGSLDAGDTSIIMPDAIDTLAVGRALNGSAQLNGHIKSIKYYPRRLTNAQLQALTEPRSDATLSLTFDGLESSFTENYIHG